MTNVAAVLEETDLYGVLTAPLSTTGTSVTARFIDKKTGVARTPQSTTLYFTINKGNSRSETIQCTSHSTASGVTTLTINGTTGRAVPKYGSGTGTTTGYSHDAGDEIGCVDIAYPSNVLSNVINGTNATGAANFRIGSEAAADQTLHFATDATTDPKIYWDDSEKRFKVNRGDDEGTAGDSELSGAVILTTAERTALTNVLDGMQVYDTTDGKFYDRTAGSWTTRESGGTFANASATVAGKVELATQAENDAGTATGATLASLSATPDVNAATIQKASWIYAADSGAADAYVVTLAPVPAAYSTGMKILVKASATNTGASTINVNSLGAKDITKHGTTALVAGDIVANSFMELEYDGTRFILLNPQLVSNRLGAIGSTVTAANLGDVTDKGETLVHGHSVLFREVRQLSPGTLGSWYSSGFIAGTNWADSAVSGLALQIAPFYRPTGYNITSVKLYIGHSGGGAVSGNIYMRPLGQSYGTTDSAVTSDAPGYDVYAYSTAADNSVAPVTIPTTAYTNWSAGEYCNFAFQRDSTNGSDTVNQAVTAMFVEVIYALA